MTQIKSKIPTGWKIATAFDCIDVRDGTHTTPKRVVNGIPLITSKNIIEGELTLIDFYNVSNEDAHEINKRSQVAIGDILMSMIGTVGEAAIIKNKPNFVVKNVGIFKAGSKEILSNYLIKQFHSRYLQNKIQSLSSGGIQKFISLGQLRKLPLLLPPLPEQEKIVEILETWDNYLEKLTKVIKAKKEIKKGLMQKLLTGKLRLKGFDDEWKYYKVEKIFHFLRTYAISRENLINNTSNIESIGNIHYGDIHSTYNSSCIDLRNISVPSVKDVNFIPDKKDLLMNGDLIMADASEDYEGIGITISIHGLESKKIVGGLHTFVLRNNDGKTEENFRQYIFSNSQIRKQLKKIANGVSVYGISKSNLSKIEIKLPSLKEQTAIAKILTTADKEIQTLEKKHQLIEDQKKFLLNNLITGRIRLPEFTDQFANVNKMVKALK